MHINVLLAKCISSAFQKALNHISSPISSVNNGEQSFNSQKSSSQPTVQGDYINMIKVKSVISSLLSRLDMFRWHIGRKEFIQLTRLKETNRKSC